MSNEKEKDALLDNFQWDSQGDFFGVPGTAEIKTLPEEKEKEEEEKEKPEEETEEKDPISFFGEDDKAEVIEEAEGGEEENPEGDEFYSTLVSEMKEKGMLNVELGEDEVINEEKFFELQDKEVESRVQETFEVFFEQLDDDGAAFLRFKKNGGSTADFFKAYSKGAVLATEDDDSFLKNYYKSVEGMDDEEIADKIEWLTENGKKAGYVEKFRKKTETAEAESKAKLLEQQKLAVQEAEKKQEEFKSTISDTLSELDTVGDFSFNTKDKKELTDYVTKASVKIGKNQFITALQDDMRKVFSSPEQLLVLAKLLKSGFDVSDIKKKTETKTTKSVKNKLQRSKESQKRSSGNTRKDVSITDFFN